MANQTLSSDQDIRLVVHEIGDLLAAARNRVEIGRSALGASRVIAFVACAAYLANGFAFRFGFLIFILVVFRFSILIIGAVRILESAVTYAVIATSVMRRAANGAIYHVVIIKKICAANAASEFFNIFAHILPLYFSIPCRTEEKYSLP